MLTGRVPHVCTTGNRPLISPPLLPPRPPQVKMFPTATVIPFSIVLTYLEIDWFMSKNWRILQLSSCCWLWLNSPHSQRTDSERCQPFPPSFLGLARWPSVCAVLLSVPGTSGNGVYFAGVRCMSFILFGVCARVCLLTLWECVKIRIACLPVSLLSCVSCAWFVIEVPVMCVEIYKCCLFLANSPLILTECSSLLLGKSKLVWFFHIATSDVFWLMVSQRMSFSIVSLSAFLCPCILSLSLVSRM